jgi:starch-binding outer membrane protein, SusD/RagB family
MIKTVKFIFLVISISLLSSCTESFLELDEPIRPTLENYYIDIETAFEGLVGCYNSLQQVPATEAPLRSLIILDIRSDDTDYCGNPRGASEENNYYRAAGFANFDIFSDNQHSSSIWNYGFRGINTINKYLDGIEPLNLQAASDQQLLEQFKAEAKFLRAYFYFVLVKNFGAVPLIVKTPDESEWFKLTRTPEDEVYKQIFKDLREAVVELPLKEQYSSAQFFRITRGAGQALLAKTLITHAGVDASSPNWEEAYQLCKAVEESAQYDLSTDFKDIFRSQGQFSNEHIFDIVIDESITGENDSYIHYFSPRFLFINGVPDQSKKMEYGFGVYGITEDMANQYGYFQGDDSLAYVNLPDQRGRYTFWARWDRYAELSVVDELNSRPETKNTETVDLANYYGRKYNRENAPVEQYWVAGSNFHVIRYAEVLLLGAEAAWYTNKPDEAIRMVNLVRERAFRQAIQNGTIQLADITINSSGNQLLEDIWQERRLELAGEGDRFFDLKRTNRLHILKEKKPEILFQEGKHELLPIPSTELSKAPLLYQNPGY